MSIKASQTLYNKYRPTQFKEVVDQNHIKVTLQNELSSGKLAHAYLFNGPRGIGKTTMARLLAKSLNCEKKKDSEPCNECDSCTSFNLGRSLHLVEIDAASQTKVEQTRENIIAASRVSVSGNHYKVFIIDEVHMLSTASFNALLKTLEEPPVGVIFILATTEIHKVPDTIISRCQRFDFHRLSISDLVLWMTGICGREKVNISEDVLVAVARQAEGGARDALSLLAQVISLGKDKITLAEAGLVLPRSDVKIVANIFRLLCQKEAAASIITLNQALDDGINLIQLTKDLVEYMRLGLLLKLTNDSELVRRELDEATQAQLRQDIQSVDDATLNFMLEILVEKYPQVKTASIPQLPLEIAFIKISFLAGPRPKSDDKPVKQPLATKTSVTEEDPKKSTPPAEITATQSQPKREDTPTATVAMDEFKDKWTDIVVALKNKHHSLSAFMLVARPISVSGNKLLLGFKYLFHKEILDNPVKRNMINEAMSEIMKKSVEVEGMVDIDYEQRENWPVNMPQILAEEEDESSGKSIDVDVAAAFS
ncbi:MAG: DNA polymerase III subunit gamma/tau [Candidatus Komeilibacteria bacterium]|nr:DNA polymerase III subunit gamma/tau [Candidatus Komeilibacteria bacterium]